MGEEVPVMLEAHELTFRGGFGNPFLGVQISWDVPPLWLRIPVDHRLLCLCRKPFGFEMLTVQLLNVS